MYCPPYYINRTHARMCVTHVARECTVYIVWGGDNTHPEVIYCCNIYLLSVLSVRSSERSDVRLANAFMYVADFRFPAHRPPYSVVLPCSCSARRLGAGLVSAPWLVESASPCDAVRVDMKVGCKDNDFFVITANFFIRIVLIHLIFVCVGVFLLWLAGVWVCGMGWGLVVTAL